MNCVQARIGRNGSTFRYLIREKKIEKKIIVYIERLLNIVSTFFFFFSVFDLFWYTVVTVIKEYFLRTIPAAVQRSERREWICLHWEIRLGEEGEAIIQL